MLDASRKHRAPAHPLGEHCQSAVGNIGEGPKTRWDGDEGVGYEEELSGVSRGRVIPIANGRGGCEAKERGPYQVPIVRSEDRGHLLPLPLRVDSEIRSDHLLGDSVVDTANKAHKLFEFERGQAPMHATQEFCKQTTVVHFSISLQPRKHAAADDQYQTEPQQRSEQFDALRGPLDSQR